MLTDELRRRTAYHEAGHAVMCYLFRRTFSYLTIKPVEGESEGHVRFTDPTSHKSRELNLWVFTKPDGFRPYPWPPDCRQHAEARPRTDVREYAEALTMIGLAGYAAEWVYFDAATYSESGENEEGCFEGDFTMVQDLFTGDGENYQKIAEAVSMSHAEADAYINLMRLRVRNLFTVPAYRYAVEGLAAALLEKTTIRRAEARRIINAALRRGSDEIQADPMAYFAIPRFALVAQKPGQMRGSNGDATVAAKATKKGGKK